MKTIAFIGHRRIWNKNNIKNSIVKLLETLINEDYSKVLIGCHGDFDNIALSSCLNFNANNSANFEINIILTSMSFLNKNKNSNSKADVYADMGCKTIFYNLENVHYKNRITISNKIMIQNCDLLICWVDKNKFKSGAKTAFNYALKQGKKVINIFDADANINVTKQ